MMINYIHHQKLDYLKNRVNQNYLLKVIYLQKGVDKNIISICL